MLNDNARHLYRITLTTKPGGAHQREGLDASGRGQREGPAGGAGREGPFGQGGRSLTHGAGVSLKSPSDHESLLLLTLVWAQVASVAFFSELSSYSHFKGRIVLSSLSLRCPCGLSRGRGKVCLLGLSSARERAWQVPGRSMNRSREGGKAWVSRGPGLDSGSCVRCVAPGSSVALGLGFLFVQTLPTWSGVGGVNTWQLLRW